MYFRCILGEETKWLFEPFPQNVGAYETKMIVHANSTRCPQAVTHLSTNRAQGNLTAVIGREPVFSTWYGRWLILHYSNKQCNLHRPFITKVQEFKISCPEIKWWYYVMVMSLSSYYSSGVILTYSCMNRFYSCSILFFWGGGWFPGLWILYADVSEHSVPSSYAV